MMLSGHVAATALTATTLQDPSAMIAMNVVLHPILDAIPHLDWHTVWTRRHGKVIGILLTVADSVIGLWLIAIMLTSLAQPAWLILSAVGAGMWLDLLDPILRRWPLLAPLRRFHVQLHAWPIWVTDETPVDWPRTITERTPDWLKFIIQAALVAAALYVLQT